MDDLRAAYSVMRDLLQAEGAGYLARQPVDDEKRADLLRLVQELPVPEDLLRARM